MKWLNKLERRFGRFCVNDLMLYIVIGMAVVFAADMFFPDYAISDRLALVPQLVLQGQVWRLITFIFIPPSSSPLLVVFALYFYWFIGSQLENEWGSYKFGIFYLIGILGSIAAGFITGYAINTYLNLSLFLAFAIMFPDMQFLLFFILPIKAKYIALVDVLLNIVMFIVGGWPVRAAIIASLINIFVFFGGDVWRGIKNRWSYRKTRNAFRRQNSASRNRDSFRY